MTSDSQCDDDECYCASQLSMCCYSFCLQCLSVILIHIHNVPLRIYIISCSAAEEAYLHPNLSSSSEKRQQHPQHISRKVCFSNTLT